jgi:hypothetical protein
MTLTLLGGYPLYLYFSDGLIDPSGEILIGRDFANYYAASQLFLTNDLQVLFDLVEYRAYLESTFGHTFELNWSYPPSYLLFVLPLALLPYMFAYVGWVSVGASLYALSLRRVLPRPNQFGVHELVILLLAPATLINVFFGQNGFIFGTLLYLGLAFTGRRPIAAGLCFGLLTIKPQLGLLIPVMLLLTHQWRTIATATLTCGAVIVVSVLIFGANTWIDYVEKVLPVQRGVMEEGTGLFLKMLPGVFGLGRLLELEPRVAYLAQLPVSLFALSVTVWLFAKARSDKEAVRLLFIVAVFLATPYAFNYDMTALTPALIAYWNSRNIEQVQAKQKFVTISLFLLPWLLFAAPVGPFILIACAVILCVEISKSSRRLSVGHAPNRVTA